NPDGPTAAPSTSRAPTPPAATSTVAPTAASSTAASSTAKASTPLAVTSSVAPTVAPATPGSTTRPAAIGAPVAAPATIPAPPTTAAPPASTAPPPTTAPPNTPPTTTVPAAAPTDTSGTTNPPPPPASADITIDITATDYAGFLISGMAGVKDAKQPQRVQLSPGPHYLVTLGGIRVDFEVTDKGKVDYDHGLDRVLSGRGSSALVVRGFAVTFDARGLDYTNTAVGGTGWLAAQPVRTLRLLPGQHSWVTPVGTGVDFKVTGVGQV